MDASLSAPQSPYRYSVGMNPIRALVPMAHVIEVEGSIDFYSKHLGFGVRSRFQHSGRTAWAWIESGAAQLMLAAASGPIDASQQAVLFYMYTDDLVSLYSRLLAGGLTDGGDYCGVDPPGSKGRGVVFRPTYPHYMPKGEIRVADPDGYILLIGQTD